MKPVLTAATMVLLIIASTPRVNAQKVFFEKYSPGQILPVDSLLFLDRLPNYSQFKVTEPAASALTPLAQIVNDPSVAGRGNELLLQDGAGLMYKNNPGWISGGFRFKGTLPFPPAVVGISVEINGVTRDLGELVLAGSGLIGGMSFSVTSEPFAYYRLRLGLVPGTPPQFGQSFRLDSGAGELGQLTLDEVGVGYLPEPSAAALACAAMPLMMFSRRRAMLVSRPAANV